jgi:DNA processing protein
LLLTEGVGRSTARRLLAAFGGPCEIMRASPAARRSAAGAAAEGLAKDPPEFAARLAATEAWLAGGPLRAIWTLGDPAYPEPLLQTADPPLMLFAEGDPACLAQPLLAIVGSRHATAQGLDTARDFARTFSDSGWCVVSGLAAGIDGAAHEGALAGAGSTVAVVGTGPDQVYPARHRALAKRVREHGLILSEFTPGTPPIAEHFPMRNRIIAGMSRGTLVVEAALKSGSLITARMALEAGREVFAIPGSIHAPQARGCHALIRQGAKLVESAADVLEELQPGLQARLPLAETGQQTGSDEPDAANPLLEALGYDPMTLDALGARTGWSAAELNVRLLELELEGQVARLPGGLFQRRAGV